MFCDVIRRAGRSTRYFDRLFLLYRKYRVTLKCESHDSYRAKKPRSLRKTARFLFPIFLLLYLCFSQYIAIFILSRLWARKSSGRASAALHPNILFIYRSIPAHLRTKSLCGVAKLREMAYNVSARKGASHILFARRENKWTQLVEVWAFYLEPHTRRASCGPLAFASFL